MSERVGKPVDRTSLEAAAMVSKEARSNLQTIFPLFVDRILLATGNNQDLAWEILQNTVQIAHISAALAVADRRVEIEMHKINPKSVQMPDDITPRQDSNLGAMAATSELSAMLEEGVVEERALMIDQHKSPLQEAPKPKLGAVKAADLYEQLQRWEEGSQIEREIAKVEADVLEEAAKNAVASVNVGEEGVFYKLPNGNWIGPGGNYGPDTFLSKMLEYMLRG